MVQGLSDDLYFDRDNKGNLIPQEFCIVVKGEEHKVKLIPLTRGELKRILSGDNVDYDDYILGNNVKVPDIGKDFNLVRPEFATALVDKVFDISGVKTEKKKERSKQFEKDDEFGKHLRKLRERRKEGDMLLFLHELGYNFYNVNNLTVWEINWIVECYNAREEKRKVESKGFKT